MPEYCELHCDLNNIGLKSSQTLRPARCHLEFSENGYDCRALCLGGSSKYGCKQCHFLVQNRAHPSLPNCRPTQTAALVRGEWLEFGHAL
ncbi:Uncharacterised protein [Vibrio cholerae]|nr:Uncharacterised protein [Vibrio cholerae]